jgi:radical SAM superfamily enzyme YgiQ (UPF0313 family)
VRARALVAPFLDWCVDQVRRRSPRIVGLTSSFQQHAASLVLAKRLKAALPDVRIVIGGANCEGVMGAETIRQFPFVDAAVSGEADTIIVDLVARLLDGRSIDAVPGVRTQATVGRDFAVGPVRDRSDGHGHERAAVSRLHGLRASVPSQPALAALAAEHALRELARLLVGRKRPTARSVVSTDRR